MDDQQLCDNHPQCGCYADIFLHKNEEQWVKLCRSCWHGHKTVWRDGKAHFTYFRVKSSAKRLCSARLCDNPGRHKLEVGRDVYYLCTSHHQTGVPVELKSGKVIIITWLS